MRNADLGGAARREPQQPEDRAYDDNGEQQRGQAARHETERRAGIVSQRAAVQEHGEQYCDDRDEHAPDERRPAAFADSQPIPGEPQDEGVAQQVGPDDGQMRAHQFTSRRRFSIVAVIPVLNRQGPAGRPAADREVRPTFVRIT